MSEIDTADNRVGDWRYLGRELAKRTFNPIKSFPFVVYFLIGIVLFGALGVWTEVIKSVFSGESTNLSGITTAVITFFAALIGSTAIILIMGATDVRDKVITSFAILFMFVFFAIALFLPVFSATHPVEALKAGVVCSLFAAWLWWITNGDNPTFRKIPPPDAATGGSTERSLPGNLSGFDV